jgi:hypothetical protein
MKRTSWYLGATVVVLAVLAALLLLRHREAAGSNGPVVAYQAKEFALDKLSLPPAISVASRDGKQYSVYPVTGILSACQIPGGSFTKLTFATTDGMTLVIEAKELDALYLSNETPNEWRLIIPSDEFKQRWVRKIAKINVE